MRSSGGWRGASSRRRGSRGRLAASRLARGPSRRRSGARSGLAIRVGARSSAPPVTAVRHAGSSSTTTWSRWRAAVGRHWMGCDCGAGHTISTPRSACLDRPSWRRSGGWLGAGRRVGRPLRGLDGPIGPKMRRARRPRIWRRASVNLDFTRRRFAGPWGHPRLRLAAASMSGCGRASESCARGLAGARRWRMRRHGRLRRGGRRPCPESGLRRTTQSRASRDRVTRSSVGVGRDEMRT